MVNIKLFRNINTSFEIQVDCYKGGCNIMCSYYFEY